MSDAPAIDAREICFVLMPFGEKCDRSGRVIDFDEIYRELVAPAVDAAGLRPLRSDEETQGGFIHKQMFERLLLCPYAVADLSTANANVYYEVGVRHAARPHTSVLVFSDETDLRFDVQPLRSLRYTLDDAGHLVRRDADRAALTARLQAAQQPVLDSPLFEVFRDKYRQPVLDHEICDTFQDRVQFSAGAQKTLQELRDRFADAPRGDDAARDAIREELAAFESEVRSHPFTDAATLVAILLAYRACEDHDRMIEMVASLPEHVAGLKVVQEQLGFALNRSGRRREARRVLEDVVERCGVNPETSGLLGRVHKDTWLDALKRGDDDEAEDALQRAIDTYLRGYRADIRDSYPGVNAVTLMAIAGDDRFDRLLPVVRYAAERRIETRPEHRRDYWDHATLFELAVVSGDREAAKRERRAARQRIREPWFADSTARNLGMFAARLRRDGVADEAAWVETEIERLLS